MNRVLIIAALALPITGWAAEAACTAAAYSRLRPPKYPSEAAKDHVGGKTIVSVVVEVDGIPRDLSVYASSGNAALDQAALESVAGWRFEPARCAGKATRSVALVPVEFNLSDDESKTPPWKIAADEEPMEFATAKEALPYLRHRSGLEERAFSMGRVFTDNASSRTWWIFESSERTWNVVDGGGWKAVMRTRAVWARDGYRGLYSYVCDGPDNWCSGLLQEQLAFLRENPMPPPASPNESRKGSQQ